MNYEYILYGIFTLILVGSFIYTFMIGKRKQRKELDNDTAEVTVKHKVMGNPVVIAYMIGFAILLGFWLYSLLY
ncbi:hypothetical protein LOK74_01065 [Brevibacillus humidisoli]|uniref:hypothetical protein n=1 Tax=Brevibacillus humidisoli TaxID=2895522 RepID=UPI001E364EE4|nr:hypothetical protein [Brevibacillus humidisoli]UFJ41182.1 hypothetical protein LOK74_01065 [Brevibacillus humidisoli]